VLFKPTRSGVHRHAARVAALAIVAAALCIVPVGRPSQSAEAARDPWFRPFASTSIWNMPIGSGAVYVDAGLPSAGTMTIDEVILRRLSASDPSRPLLQTGSWQQRCTGSVPTGTSLPIPDSFIVPDAYQRPDGGWTTPNNVAAFLMPDGRTVVNTNGVARCTPGGPIFGWQTGNPAKDRTDLYGDGRLGSHGASHLSGLGGAIRPGELSGGAPLQHALDLLVWGKHLAWAGDGYRWPAAAADSYASSSYLGANPELQMGSLLAIPPGTTPEQLGITSDVGRRLFAAMQDYGGYVTDEAGWDAHYFTVDQAAVGTFAWGPAEKADMNRIMDAAHVVANNSPTSIGGGGSPRQPLLPELTALVRPPLPARILDTRSGGSSIDGKQVAEGALAAGGTTAVQVAGRAGVPVGAAAALLNVTITEATDDGFATVYPCGGQVPNTSTVNFQRGRSTANAALVGLDASGRACVATSARADVIVDVSGSFASNSDLRSIAPTRLLDTRSPEHGARTPGTVTRLPVAGIAGIPAKGSVGLVALNVTVTEPWRAGFASVYPCRAAPPATSNLNFEAGLTRANAVFVAPDAAGDVCVYIDAPGHIIVDAVGWSPAGSKARPLEPARIADTRRGATTIDGIGAGTGALDTAGVVAVAVLGRAGVPAQGVQSVLLNVTTTASHRDGFLTVYPCGFAVPTTSTVNHLGGRSVAGAALVRVGDGGRVCVFTDSPGDVVVDVTGYVAS
jgi:hypothetical protein